MVAAAESVTCHVSRVVWRVTPVHCALHCALIELSAALPAAWCGQLVRLWSCSHAACLIIGNILIISLCLCLIPASNNVNYSSHIHKYLYKYPQCTENGLTPPVLTILGSVYVLIVRWWMVVAGWPGDQLHTTLHLLTILSESMLMLRLRSCK